MKACKGLKGQNEEIKGMNIKEKSLSLPSLQLLYYYFRQTDRQATSFVEVSIEAGILFHPLFEAVAQPGLTGPGRALRLLKPDLYQRHQPDSELSQ